MNKKERNDLVNEIDELETELEHLYEVCGQMVERVRGLRDSVTHPESEKHLRCPNCDSTNYNVERMECGVCGKLVD